VRTGAPHFREVEVTCRRLGVVLSPDGSEREAEGVLNPGVARDRRGRLLLFPRMVAPGNVSRIGIARGVTRAETLAFERVGVALEPHTPYEARESEAGGHGCEDARVTYVPSLDRYLMAYTAFGPLGARIAIAVSHDAYAWERVGLLHFADERWNATDNKDAAFFPDPVRSPAGAWCYAVFHRPMLPETINGQTPIPVIVALPPERREAARIAYIPVEAVARRFENICHAEEDALFLPVGDTWGRLKNGAGTPPVRIGPGWLSIFHGVDAIDRDGRPQLYYSAGIVIADGERPDQVLYRSAEPILVPETRSERYGTVADVVFPTGLDPRLDGQWDMYYGAADAKISRARIALSVSH
jgi:predicted GH43/DUF377 family glycosyl hydrolase